MIEGSFERIGWSGTSGEKKTKEDQATSRPLLSVSSLSLFVKVPPHRIMHHSIPSIHSITPQSFRIPYTSFLTPDRLSDFEDFS